MKQKTAVEWLFLMLNNPNRDQDFLNKLLDKAKEMHKAGITQAYDDGAADQSVWEYTGCIDFDKTGEQYYTEKYE
jgi:hypothetical protein